MKRQIEVIFIAGFACFIAPHLVFITAAVDHIIAATTHQGAHPCGGMLLTVLDARPSEVQYKFDFPYGGYEEPVLYRLA